MRIISVFVVKQKGGGTLIKSLSLFRDMGATLIHYPLQLRFLTKPTMITLHITNIGNLSFD